MARRKSTEKKVSKPKSKAKLKEVLLVPRLRLEPRLPSKSVSKVIDKKSDENSVFSTKNEIIDAHDKNLQNIKDAFLEIEEKEQNKILPVQNSLITNENISDVINEHTFNSYEETDKTVESETIDKVVKNERKIAEIKSQRNKKIRVIRGSCEETDKTVERETIDKVVKNEGNITEIKSQRNKIRIIRGSRAWTDKELMNFAVGLQLYGFSETNKVADVVKTKDANFISNFIKKRSADSFNNKNTRKGRGRSLNKWTKASPESIETWPTIRKWRRLASDQIMNHVRLQDYTKLIILALCKKFYEEEEESSDPQVSNAKHIYKYLMDCMAGEVPAQLPPMESAVLLDLLREVRWMPIAYDFEEERKFLENFKTATTFKPFELKDEFKRKFSKGLDVETPTYNTISVPEKIFLDLSRHKKVVQSFNPLVTPVWMMQKEQEYLEKYFKESDAYVD